MSVKTRVNICLALSPSTKWRQDAEAARGMRELGGKAKPVFRAPTSDAPAQRGSLVQRLASVTSHRQATARARALRRGIQVLRSAHSGAAARRAAGLNLPPRSPAPRRTGAAGTGSRARGRRLEPVRGRERRGAARLRRRGERPGSGPPLPQGGGRRWPNLVPMTTAGGGAGRALSVGRPQAAASMGLAPPRRGRLPRSLQGKPRPEAGLGAPDGGKRSQPGVLSCWPPLYVALNLFLLLSYYGMSSWPTNWGIDVVKIT